MSWERNCGNANRIKFCRRTNPRDAFRKILFLRRLRDQARTASAVSSSEFFRRKRYSFVAFVFITGVIIREQNVRYQRAFDRVKKRKEKNDTSVSRDDGLFERANFHSDTLCIVVHCFCTLNEHYLNPRCASETNENCR